MLLCVMNKLDCTYVYIAVAHVGYARCLQLMHVNAQNVL